MDTSHRRRWMIGGGAVLVVAVAAFALFRPDKLFVDQVVDEDIDPAVAAVLDEEPGATTSDAPDPTPEDAAPGDAPSTTATTTTTTTTVPGPELVAGGSWVSLGHSTEGDVAVVDDAGTRSLIFADLVTTNGPDLQVYLSPAEVTDDADYIAGAVKIGPLKGNIGTQSYELPAEVDLSAFRSVVIWCERFSYGFGAAPLENA